ncbi:MAG: Formylmethanofuran dehydrogenase subunit E [Anaerolineae bacterium]|nr:MAG: Formylmethanofuran dehydrogenase subunit E [Anaerolineae bacterium]
MDIDTFLQWSASHHSHLCPRQVLGVRMGLAGLQALGLSAPPPPKRLLVISETDGCFCDGLIAVTACSVGHRNLRIADYGKVAATFVDLESELAVRIAPQNDIRQKAWRYAAQEQKAYFAQLVGYRHMPDEELFNFQIVQLQPSAKKLLSRPAVRVNCAACGEEIINEREVVVGDQALCKTCAGQGYYVRAEPLLFPSLSATPLFSPAEKEWALKEV